jgi:anti-sigma B factor antagonist
VAALGPISPLRVEKQADGSLALVGELDMASAPQLRAALEPLLTAGPMPVTLDLSGLQFCDSTGIGALVWAHVSMPDRLVLRAPTDRVRNLLMITNLDREFDIR